MTRTPPTGKDPRGTARYEGMMPRGVAIETLGIVELPTCP